MSQSSSTSGGGGGGVSLANDVNNYVVTATGSGLNGESNLTYDGSLLLSNNGSIKAVETNAVAAASNKGIYGECKGAAAQTNHGGYFLAYGGTVANYGVLGDASGSGAHNVGGYFTAAGATTNIALFTKGDVQFADTGGSNRFIWDATAGDWGLGIGRTPSTYELEVQGTIFGEDLENGGTAIFGQAGTTGTTGNLIGVKGDVNANVGTGAAIGYGVWGNCAGNPAQQYGAYFQTAGTAEHTSTDAYGVYANVTVGPTDNAYGGYFTAGASNSGGNETDAAFGVKSYATGNATSNYGGWFTASGGTNNRAGIFAAGAGTIRRAIETNGGDVLFNDNADQAGFIFDASTGNVGIGQSTASTYQLEVAGTVASTIGMFRAIGTNQPAYLRSTGTGVIKIGDVDGTGEIQLGAAGGNVQVVNKLGIGVQPSHQLTLESATSPNHLKILNTSASDTNQGAGIMLAHDDQTSEDGAGRAMQSNDQLGLIQFQGAEDASSTMKVGASISCIATAPWSDTMNDGALIFKTNDGDNTITERMRLDSDGHLGIGVDAGYRLHAEDNVDGDYITYLRNINDNGPVLHIKGGTTANDVALLSCLAKGSEVALSVRSNQRVGIGVALPAAKLEVKYDDSVGADSVIFKDSGDTTCFEFNSQGEAYIRTDLGIGTDTPQLVALDAVGAMSVSGAVWATGARDDSLVIDNNAGNARFYAVEDASTQGSFDFFTATTDGGATSRMTIGADGDITVGEASSIRWVNGNNQITGSGSGGSNYLRFSTGGATTQTMGSDGQIEQPVHTITPVDAETQVYEVDMTKSNIQKLVLHASNANVTINALNAEAGRTVTLLVDGTTNSPSWTDAATGFNISQTGDGTGSFVDSFGTDIITATSASTFTIEITAYGDNEATDVYGVASAF